MSRQAEPGLDPESRSGWTDWDLLPPSATRSWPGCMDYCWTWRARRRAAGIRWLRLSGPDLDDLARQAAADALTAITTQLDGFRGQSRFRTWASKFAMSGVSATAPRRAAMPGCGSRLALAPGTSPGQGYRPPLPGVSPRPARSRARLRPPGCACPPPHGPPQPA